MLLKVRILKNIIVIRHMYITKIFYNLITHLACIIYNLKYKP